MFEFFYSCYEQNECDMGSDLWGIIGRMFRYGDCECGNILLGM